MSNIYILENHGHLLFQNSGLWTFYNFLMYAQVSAINNINAMLAQATSSIRNENESLLAGKLR